MDVTFLIIKTMQLEKMREMCEICKSRHTDEHPHNAESPYYKSWFKEKYGRLPTWNDAIAHCEIEYQQRMKKRLKELGIDPFSTNTKAPPKAQKTLKRKNN